MTRMKPFNEPIYWLDSFNFKLKPNSHVWPSCSSVAFDTFDSQFLQVGLLVYIKGE